MFPKRTRVELDRHKLQSLRLRETNVETALRLMLTLYAST